MPSPSSDQTTTFDESSTALEGWLAKRSRGVASKVWHDRYFILRGSSLSYYMEPATGTPRGVFHLSSSCAVSDIYLKDGRKTNKAPVIDTQQSPGEQSSSLDTVNTITETTASLPLQPSFQTLYCIEITWLKNTEDSESSSHRPSSMDMFTSNKSSSASLTRASKHSIHATASTSNLPLTAPTTSTADLAAPSYREDDSGPPTPVTDHRSFRRTSITHHTHASNPPKHPFSIYSTLRRRKFLLKHSDSNKQSHDSNLSQTSTTPTSPKKLRIPLLPDQSLNKENSSKSTTTHLEPLYIPQLSNHPTEDKDQNTHNVEFISPTPSGLTKHYTNQMEQHQRKVQLRNDTRLKFEIMQQTEKQIQLKQKRVKQFVRAGEYAAAVGGAVAIGVFTAGIGWVVGLVVLCVSAAAGGSSAMAEMGLLWKKTGPRRKLVIAAESLETIQEWKHAIEYVIAWMLEEECLAMEQHLVGNREQSTDPTLHTDVKHENRNTGNDIGTLATTNVPLSSVSRWEPLEGGWATLLGVGSLGIRIFREETSHDLMLPTSLPRMRNMLRLGIQGRPSPPLKTQVIVKAHPLNAFMCLMTRMSYDERFTSSFPLEKSGGKLVPNSGQRASFRLIETIDDNSDIIHLFFRPLYMFPVWTAPRDFVLFRYWRHEENGTYTIMYDSVEHNSCPPMNGYVRGQMNGIYTIAPPRNKRGMDKYKNSKGGVEYFRSVDDECLVTHVVQVDPRWNIPNIPQPCFAYDGYTEAFAASVLSLVLDIRDALDLERFVAVPLDGSKPPAYKEAIARFRKSVTVSDQYSSPRKDPSYIYHVRSDEDDDDDEIIEDQDDDNHYDHRFSILEVRGRARTLTDGDVPALPNELTSSLFSTVPQPFALDQWAEPEGNSFRVRGKTYKTDGIKINAGDSLFPLLAVDIVGAESILTGGLCSHPLERVQRGLAREREAKARGIPNNDMPAFIFCVNIVLAGPSTVHLAFFYGIDDMSKIDGSNGTPSSILAKEFFFGESDEFRNSTFKLIPRIVDGNYLVRKAVGSTPAILGRKIKQSYIRTDRFFELIVDTGSDSVARGVLRLCSSYSKYLVADMAFLLEGYDETTLPERILGSARVKNIDLSKDVRNVGLDHIHA